MNELVAKAGRDNVDRGEGLMPSPEWNGIRTRYERNATIHALFEKQVCRTPSDVALIFGEVQLTYDHLNRRANRLARRLRRLHVSRDVPVGVCMGRSADMVTVLLAVLKAGGAYVPIDPTYPPERRSLMIREAAMDVIICDPENRTWSATAKQTLCVDDKIFSGFSDDNLPYKGEAENLCYIMFTSGSTGVPKGVAVVHRGVVRLVRNTNYASFDRETFLHVSPVSFDAATFEIWGALLNGGKLVVMPPAPPTLREIGRAVRDHRVTTLLLTTGLFHAMVDERPADLRSLRQLLTGGDVLSLSHASKAFAALPGVRIVNGYGPTESTTYACCHVLTAETKTRSSVPIGKPIANTTAYILDAQLKTVPVGTDGELYIGGDGLARGYWNSPKLTAAKFVRGPSVNVRGARLYRTGDLARWRDDGEIEFLGRIDYQVKVRGYRIELGEIENTLRRQADVLDAVVLMREGAPGHKQLVAYVVRKRRSSVKWHQRVLKGLSSSLPEYMVPSAVIALPALPRTPNGKLDPDGLPAPDFGRKNAGSKSAAPTTPFEKKIAAVWQELFGLERVTLEDNFFALGGHSLLGLRLVNRLREICSGDIPLTIIFEAPTLGEMTRILAKNNDAAGRNG